MASPDSIAVKTIQSPATREPRRVDNGFGEAFPETSEGSDRK
jgi:hypothetical protein